MHAAAFGSDKAGYRAMLAEVAKLHPLGRVGKPDEVAALIAYLASPAAAWVTGVLYPIDGGISLT